MLYGILIGLGLAAIMVVIVIALGYKNLKPLSYVVIVLALAAFIIEGIKMVNAISARNNVADHAEMIQEAALAFLPSQAQNYQMDMKDAMAVKLGLRFAFPKEAAYIEPSDLAGHSIAECTDVLKDSVIRSSGNHIWKMAICMAVTMLLSTVLIILSTKIGGGKSNTNNMRSRQTHGRSLHRGRRSTR